ncbi:hypothetical protein FKW77_003079 [Venturia effusa]|uniref:Protein kinase domain-containing protein n=1 Tax=Venturia effusa TaxID=50376 RepID=A0A517LL39_9PEZI|nr:hypothetical protein FKW77_003079 [Venturia effusa]
MDFLKSAVLASISKGPAFPYSFDTQVDIDQSIWTLHNGTKREDGSKCSIFSFDIAANKSRLPLARNALRKLRTLRHPGVIKVLDTVETETYIYIATERLVPLTWHVKRRSLAPETIKWGLNSIAKTLKFVNGEATSVHGCVRASSIFTGESGEWKLGGLEVLSSLKEDDAIIYTYGSLVPDSGRYAPPEVVRGGWEAIKSNPITAADAYDFGILIYEVFNSTYSSADQLSQPKLVPPKMQQSYKRLINANPKPRISVSAFLDIGRRSDGFFDTPLIHLTEDIDNLGLKSENEKQEFLEQLDQVSDDFPEEFFKMKVLPELLKSVEFGGGGPQVLNVVFKIGTKLSDEEYEQRITPVVIRLFANPDRALRVCLLDNLPRMIDRLSQKVVSNNIFPQMVTGFSDPVPLVREQTLKSVLVVVPKLSDRTINGELLRHLAKTANDEQPGIRTNTTICLGKIARNLGANSRTKVLTAAFGRAMKDPFVHARNAALLALAATADLFSDDDCATKILPGICPSMVDKEKLVRDSANKTMEIYLTRVKKYAQTLPDTVIQPAAVAGEKPRMGTPAVDASGWAGWAISSFTNKLGTVSGQMAAPSNGISRVASPESRSSSVPPPMTKVPTGSGPKPKTKPASSFPASTDAWDASETISQAEDEDFDTGWGDDNPWGKTTEDVDPFAAPPAQATTATPFEDGGEPDFAGWIAAQANAKSKKPLPKGLAKPKATTTPSTRPGMPKAKSTGGVIAAKKTIPVVKPLPKAKEEDADEDAWGDAW